MSDIMIDKILWIEICGVGFISICANLYFLVRLWKKKEKGVTS